MCRISVHRLVATGLATLMIAFCQISQAIDNHMLIRLTTTTSTVNSGLMEKLKPAFETDTGYTLKIESYGTGRALRSAREGNADIIIVHAPEAELLFMEAGFGLSRQPLMKNEFVIAGPETDPAGIANTPDIISGFRAIADKQSAFISRGDDSGTHRKEQEIWDKAGIIPYGKWYIEYGYGMGKTLSYANEQNAYVLVDKATWLANRSGVRLVLLFRGDELLKNPYHIITVNPARHPAVNLEGAQRFVQWITSKRGQDIILQLTVDGEQLFTPDR